VIPAIAAFADAAEPGSTAVNALSLISVPDIFTPAQFFDLSRSSETTPEKRLMLAILEDAIRCFRGHAYQANGSPTADRAAALQLEAEKWIFDDDTDAPVTFHDICMAFGIHPEWMRAGLQNFITRGQPLPRRSPAKAN